MAANDRDLADHLATIRADIGSLTQTVGQLASDTAGIQRSLMRRVSNAARSATDAGERFLSDAERWGGEAVHAAERGAAAAVAEVQEEIERNPLMAVLIAAGFGLAVGFLARGSSRPAPVATASARRRHRA